MASATVLDSGGVHCWGGAPCPLCPLTGRHRLRCLPPSKRNRSATSWRPPPAPPPTYTHLWLVPLSHSARCWHQHPTPPAGTQAPSPSEGARGWTLGKRSKRGGGRASERSVGETAAARGARCAGGWAGRKGTCDGRRDNGRRPRHEGEDAARGAALPIGDPQPRINRNGHWRRSRSWPPLWWHGRSSEGISWPLVGAPRHSSSTRTQLSD